MEHIQVTPLIRHHAISYPQCLDPNTILTDGTVQSSRFKYLYWKSGTITAIDIDSLDVIDINDLACLRSFTSLQYLRLHLNVLNADIHNMIMESISGLTTLKRLELTYHHCEDDYHTNKGDNNPDNQSQISLSNLINVQEFISNGCHYYTDNDLHAISNMKPLKYLTLLDCGNITADGISHMIESLPQLIILNMSGSAVTGDLTTTMNSIAMSQSLELINLSGWNVNDDHVRIMTRSTTIWGITLNDCIGITDESINILNSMPGLLYIKVRSDHLSYGGITVNECPLMRRLNFNCGSSMSESDDDNDEVYWDNEGENDLD